mmetsp:Transcript_18818/g.23696  ORF Transcript_18818/g.23696 Transcript_18818/m.23696 type:complete len:83 (+) Transcript_18818:543-791(+)
MISPNFKGFPSQTISRPYTVEVVSEPSRFSFLLNSCCRKGTIMPKDHSLLPSQLQTNKFSITKHLRHCEQLKIRRSCRKMEP